MTTTMPLPAVPAELATAGAAGPVPYRAGDVEITGADWLDYMRQFYARYVYWPSPAALDAAVLWAAHTYARDPDWRLIWSATPRLFMLSSKPASGKSTVLRLLARTCPRVGGIDGEPTEYGLILSIGAEQPTLLIDEADVLLGGGSRKAGVRTIILNGYTPDGSKLRERRGKVERVRLFAPLAMAGLDVIEKTMSENVATILSRGLIIRMAPAPAGGQPADLDEDEDQVAETVRRIRIAGTAWTLTNRDWLRAYRPDAAEGATGRWRQIWRPLLTMADGAGRDWPQRAREACVALQSGAAGSEDEAELAALLAGIRR
jgi:hypothetical protein